MSAAKQTVNLPPPPRTHGDRHTGVFPKAALLFTTNPLGIFLQLTIQGGDGLAANSLGQDPSPWVSLSCRLLTPNILVIMHKVTAPLPAQICPVAEAV